MKESSSNIRFSSFPASYDRPSSPKKNNYKLTETTTLIPLATRLYRIIDQNHGFLEQNIVTHSTKISFHNQNQLVYTSDVILFSLGNVTLPSPHPPPKTKQYFFLRFLSYLFQGNSSGFLFYFNFPVKT